MAAMIVTFYVLYKVSEPDMKMTIDVQWIQVIYMYLLHGCSWLQLTLIGINNVAVTSGYLLEIRSTLIYIGESNSTQLGTTIVNFLRELGFGKFANTTERVIETSEDIILGGLLGLASMSTVNILLLGEYMQCFFAVVPLLATILASLLCFVSLLLTFRSVRYTY